MSRALKRKINYSHVARETYASMGFPGGRELADMFEFLRVYTPSRRTHIALCRQLFADMQRFETWLENNVQKFNSLFEAYPLSLLASTQTAESKACRCS